MAPRASWKGYLKLSLVSCPVRLYTATSSGDKIAFHMLHKDTHNRVQMKPIDPELGQVERADLVKGYEFEKDQYVIVDDEDLEAVQVESNKTIAVESFVDAGEIDTMFLDSSYYMAPDGPVAEETYCVLRDAMQQRNKAAVAKVVLFGRERRVVLTVRGAGFVVTTLRTAKEVRRAEDYFADIKSSEADKQTLELANHLIEQNEGSFDSSGFDDRYQAGLLEVVKAKLKGTTPVIAKAPERGEVINLMDALKLSLEAGKKPPAQSKGRGKASKPAAGKTAKPAAKSKRKRAAAG